MPEFVSLEKQNQDKPKVDSTSDVQKAKDAAEIQKHETERIKSQREAVLAENDIKDSQDLKAKLATVTERETKLAKDFMDFENKRMATLSDLQKQKAELDRRNTDLTTKERDLLLREKNAELREKLVKEREELMTSVEQQKLAEADAAKSIENQLKHNFPRIAKLLNECANLIDQSGFHGMADGLWEELETMFKWSQNDITKHKDVMIQWLKEEVEDCNQKAVMMSRSPQQYPESLWNTIVDNLEEIYKLIPTLRPAYLPKNED